MDFKKIMESSEYDFLRENERLGKRIMLMGLGGSHAYGTSNENSDIDFRGVTLQMPSDLLGLTQFEQYEDNNTDTVIYGFNKLIKLLLDCNPNTSEMLGLDEDQYLIKTELGQELIDNTYLFLSKRAIKSLVELDVVDSTEVIGAKEVLNAAALTYVASVVVSLLNLLRFILVFARRDD